MQRLNALLSCLFASGAAFAAAASPDATAIAWQHRAGDFDYFGTTSSYTCNALEAQVRKILSYLGARPDMKVSARGCPVGPDIPSHTASVHAEFYVPAPAAAACAADSAMAQWTRVELTPRRPGFVEAGDCELVEQMKPLVVKNFSFRNFSYHTSCFPNEMNNWGFSVEGEALMVRPGRS